MSTNRLLLIACGLYLAILPSHVLGMEVHLSEHWSDAVVISFSNTKSDYSVFSLQDPSRVVVDVANINESKDIVITGVEDSSIVSRVRQGVLEIGEQRFVFDISQEYKKRSVEWWKEGNKTKVIVEANQKEPSIPEAIRHGRSSISKNPQLNTQPRKNVTLNALGSANAVAKAAAGDEKTSPLAVCTTWKLRVRQAMANQVFGYGSTEAYIQIRRIGALDGDYYYLTGAEDAVGQITNRAFSRYHWSNMEDLEEWEAAINDIEKETYRDCLGQMFRKQDQWVIDERARSLID